MRKKYQAWIGVTVGLLLLFGCGEEEEQPIATSEEIEVEIVFEATNQYRNCYWDAFSRSEFCDWFFGSLAYEGRIINTSEGKAPFVILKMQVKKGENQIQMVTNTRTFRNLRAGEVRPFKGVFDLKKDRFLFEFKDFKFYYEIEVHESPQ